MRPMKPVSVVLSALVAGITVATLSGQGGGRGGVTPQPPPPPGDAAAGQALYQTNKCADCHRIGDTGSRVGPDLSVVGQLRSPDSLQLALEAPDDEVLPEHRRAKIVLRDGATVTGRLLNQDAFTVQVLTDKEELKSYARANLREYTILDKGLMPSYKGKLTPQQIIDIVNYLATLKPAPATGGRQ